MGAHKSPGNWEEFWKWVRSEPELTTRLVFLVAVVLLSVSAIVSAIVIPAIMG